MRRLIEIETGVRALWKAISAGCPLEFHGEIRELIGQFPTGSYKLRSVTTSSGQLSAGENDAAGTVTGSVSVIYYRHQSGGRYCPPVRQRGVDRFWSP